MTINIYFGPSTFHPLGAYFFCLAHGPSIFKKLTGHIYFTYPEDNVQARGIIFLCLFLIFSVWQKAMDPFFSAKSLLEIKEKLKVVEVTGSTPPKSKKKRKSSQGTKEKKGVKRTKR